MKKEQRWLTQELEINRDRELHAVIDLLGLVFSGRGAKELAVDFGDRRVVVKVAGKVTVMLQRIDPTDWESLEYGSEESGS